MNDALTARAHGQAALTARIRSVPEDFAVDEIDAFAAWYASQKGTP